MAKPKPYRTEADLCAAFIAGLGDGWIAYAETAGWDILLVRGTDGFQIGVQAKLKLNALVLSQALDDSRHAIGKSGPDCRAVLVPWDEVSAGLSFLCAYIGITILRMAPPPDAGKTRKNFGRPKFDPCLPEIGKDWIAERNWFEQAPIRRCELPEYIPDVRAGAPSPLQLTDWKIRALKIAVLLEVKGHVTKADFRYLNLDHRRWLTRGAEWLKLQDEGRYIAAPQLPDFKRQHPVVYEQIKADHDKWSRPPVEPGRLL